MFTIWEPLHVGSYLRHQHMQNVPTDPIDFFTALDLFLERAQVTLDLFFQVQNRTILCLDEGKQFSEQEAMVLPYFSRQCSHHSVPTRMHTRMYSPGQTLRVAFSFAEGLQD